MRGKSVLIIYKANQRILGPYSPETDEFTVRRGTNPFEKKINQLADEILEVHRVGVSMSFLEPDNVSVALIHALKKRVRGGNP
jgi:hypothetical protein